MTTPHQSSTQGSPAGATPVTWLLERARLPDDARPLAAGATDGAAVVQALTANARATEAVQVIAAALPPREGVWWAWVSARHAAQLTAQGGTPAPAVAGALDAVERWIATPDEDGRRAAWAAGERAGLETAAGCAAAAIFFTAGSVAPPDIAPVPAPPGINNMLVGSAVALAAAADPAHFDALVGAYVAQGLEVVKQLGGWDKSVALARQHFESQQDRHTRALAPQPGSPAAPRPAP